MHCYPLFEWALDVYCWRLSPFRYLGNTDGYDMSAADYLHDYWLRRYTGFLSATE